VPDPQQPVVGEQRREAGTAAHHRRVGELAAQARDLDPVIEGPADLEGLSAAGQDGDGRASPPGGRAGNCPPQPATLATMPVTASSNHPYVMPRRTAEQLRRLLQMQAAH
jgi:hypothetical protein